MSQPANDAPKTRTETILADIEDQQRKAEAAGDHFTLPTGTREKVAGSKQPLIVWQAWNAIARPGQLLVLSIGIANPTPHAQRDLFLHVFVGYGNIQIGEGMADSTPHLPSIDATFPQLTMPRYPGAVVEAGKTQEVSLGIKVPAASPASNYIGNSVLFQARWHEPGRLLDQGQFIFEVR